MYLTRHRSAEGPRWALDERFLPSAINLGLLLQVPRAEIAGFLCALPRTGAATGTLLAPVEAGHEVWAAGVTYVRSREARESESSVKDVYSRVYEAERPELFFKAPGWRVGIRAVRTSTTMAADPSSSRTRSPVTRFAGPLTRRSP